LKPSQNTMCVPFTLVHVPSTRSFNDLCQKRAFLAGGKLLPRTTSVGLNWEKWKELILQHQIYRQKSIIKFDISDK
jgi:hypothetical protein